MSLLPLVLLLALRVVPVDPGSSTAPAPLRQVAVDVAGALEARTLLREGFDVLHPHGAGTTLELLCTDPELRRLERLGFAYRVIHADTAAFYAARLARPRVAGPPPAHGAWLSPPFGAGEISGYYSYDEVTSVLEQIAAAYPQLVTKQSLGQSIEGRELWVVKVSDSPAVDEPEPDVRFDALHHCREPGSMQTVLWTLLFLVEEYGADPLATWLVDNRQLWFVPVVNPDGYVWNQTTNPNGGGLWKKNRRDNGDGTIGVELNRNYPFQWGLDNVGSSGSTSHSFYRGTAPASEPEVAALVALMEERSFEVALSCHTFSAFWMYPWVYTTDPPPQLAEILEVSYRATEINGYTPGQASHLLYVANGVTIDTDQGTYGSLAWSPEIGSYADGFYPPPERIVPLAEENRIGLLRSAMAAGASPYLRQEARVELGDGDGRYEPGEAVELTLSVRNAGVAASLGPVAVSVVAAHPALAVAAPATRSLGVLESFSGADAAPFRLDIDPSAVPGELLGYEVRVTWEGYTEATSASLALEPVRPFLRDDLEVDLGWIAGLPGDGAIGGLWEYGDPLGTSSGAEQLNPEDDATPGSEALRCFTTGNGATTVAGDDVDGGPTTLVSPALHLASVDGARVSYARWFADFGTLDDRLAVSISDDDGATWTPLETVTEHANEWTRPGFAVEDFVALTDAVRLRFVAADIPSNSILEAAVDDLLVEVEADGARMNVFGRPAVGTPVALHVAGSGGAAYGVLQSTGTGFFRFASIAGPLLLDPAGLEVLLQGTLAPDGLGRSVVPIPARSDLIGTTLWFQAIVAGPAGYELTNRQELTFE